MKFQKPLSEKEILKLSSGELEQYENWFLDYKKNFSKAEDLIIGLLLNSESTASKLKNILTF